MTTQPLDLGGYTVDDLETVEDDGLHDELEDGCLVVSPSDVFRHRSAAFQLGLLLQPALLPDWLVVPSPGLLFSRRDYREPDLVVVRRGALAKKMADRATCC